MKANNGKGNNSSRDEWETPNLLFNILNKQYNFEFDCCALKRNRKCYAYPNDFMESTVLPCAWMNPPFSKAKEMFEHFFKVVKEGVAIYRFDNSETKIWQDVIFPNADWIFIPNKRISYEGSKGNGARFPSALIGIGVNVPKGLLGTTIRLSSHKA